MQKSQKRKHRLFVALVVVAAAVAVAVVTTSDVGASQGQCEVLDLNLPRSSYPLPTDLTIKVSEENWCLNFTLQGEEQPTACVNILGTKERLILSLFKGGCQLGTKMIHKFLNTDLMPLNNWTTFYLDVKDHAILVTEPNSNPIEVKAGNWLLPHDTLQVTFAQGVEAAVGCHGNCPLYKHTSEGPNVKTKAKELWQENEHFYFRPGEAFDKLLYQVVCKTQQGKEHQSDVDIPQGKDGAAGVWHQVKLGKQVHINNTLLEDIYLPKSCVTYKYVIWIVGDASFAFDCKPKEVIEEEMRNSANGDTEMRNSANGDTISNYMKWLAPYGILICMVVVLAIILILINKYVDGPERGIL